MPLRRHLTKHQFFSEQRSVFSVAGNFLYSFFPLMSTCEVQTAPVQKRSAGLTHRLFRFLVCWPNCWFFLFSLCFDLELGKESFLGIRRELFVLEQVKPLHLGLQLLHWQGEENKLIHLPDYCITCGLYGNPAITSNSGIIKGAI